MTVITVLYPAEGGAFDHAYYAETHMPLVHSLWGAHGLSGSQVLRGVAGPDGKPPSFTVVTSLTFSSIDAFKAAAAMHGAEIFADIPNFTKGQPILQFSEVAG